LRRKSKGSLVPQTPAPFVYQVKVILEGFRPPIWRRLLVPSTVTLKQFHRVLQIAMGWTDSHLRQFLANGVAFDPDHFEVAEVDAALGHTR